MDLFLIRQCSCATSNIQSNLGLLSPHYYGNLSIKVTLAQSQMIFNTSEWDDSFVNMVTSLLK